MSVADKRGRIGIAMRCIVIEFTVWSILNEQGETICAQTYPLTVPLTVPHFFCESATIASVLVHHYLSLFDIDGGVIML